MKIKNDILYRKFQKELSQSIIISALEAAEKQKHIRKTINSIIPGINIK